MQAEAQRRQHEDTNDKKFSDQTLDSNDIKVLKMGEKDKRRRMVADLTSDIEFLQIDSDINIDYSKNELQNLEKEKKAAEDKLRNEQIELAKKKSEEAKQKRERMLKVAQLAQEAKEYQQKKVEEYKDKLRKSIMADGLIHQKDGTRIDPVDHRVVSGANDG